MADLVTVQEGAERRAGRAGGFLAGKGDFPTAFVAWSFLAAAGMLWGGWAAMPSRIGTYFEADDFAGVYAHWHWWIWAFRVHLFGMVVTAIALVALASLLTHPEARVMVWPGAAVATAGMIVGAVGAAFYYHHGAWGALHLYGKSPEEARAFVESLRTDTEYVTCLVRFGRVFSGLGLVLLGLGLVKGKVVSAWVGWGAVAVGLAAMALTMLLPDRLSLYLPVFHAKALWLAAFGAVLLRGGLRPGGVGSSIEPA